MKCLCLYKALVSKKNGNNTITYSEEYIIASGFYAAQEWAKKNIPDLYDVFYVTGGTSAHKLYFVEDGGKPERK